MGENEWRVVEAGIFSGAVWLRWETDYVLLI